ncbi:MAG TPA: S41 family peptidase [Longimicrobiales bacterium]
MRNRHHKLGIALACAAAAFVVVGFLLPAQQRPGPRLFQEVFTLVSSRFVDSLDVSALYEKAARGLVEELDDPYASLYSPDELEDFTITHEGHYAGVGMIVEDQDGAAIVSRVFPNTPSERAGIRVGDQIIALDGESTRGWELSRVANGLKGEPGTVVEVRLARPGAETSIDVRMTRAEIHIPAVPYATLLDDGAGYIPLLQFSESAAEEVEAAVRRLVDEGATGLVLDLRGNGGGILDEAIAIAGLFLPRGTPVARQWERVRSEMVYRSPAEPLAPDLPLVVLIDQWSASASEIVAGALQDHDRALLIGARSFGKGLVQSAYRLDGGYILKMTTGKWYTPSGRSIHRERGEDGRLVQAPDSAAADSARPIFHTDGGRVVYGGGGIVPDIAVAPDTLPTTAREFVEAVVARSQDVHLTLFDYAFELKDTVEPGFEVRPEWRDELYRRLQARGVSVDREIYDRAAGYIDRMLAERVARLAFGDAAAKRREIKDDAPLRRALELLREGGTQRELIARAEGVASGG